MSYQAWFEQTEAVAKVLDEYVKSQTTHTDYFKRPDDEVFTAVWQAVELLSRAYTVLLPMVQAEAAKVALNLPDVVEKKATLYGPRGETL